MRFGDLPEFWKDYLSGHWDKETRAHWGDISNYLEAWDSEQFLHLASHVGGDLDEVMRPDSPFSLAYADWMRTGKDRDSWEYANMLYEADWFDSPDDAYAHYHED